MRSLFQSVLLALAIATPLHAAEELKNPALAAEEEVETVAEHTPVMAAEAEVPAGTDMKLAPVQVENTVTVDEAEAGQLPARGSFWWLVGVVVVAGVILAVLL